MKALLGLCAAGLACWASPAPAAAAGITWDCDTAADHFSELVLPAADPSFIVSGNVQLNVLAPSKKYVPVVRVQISSSSAPGTSPQASAGFSLTVVPADPKKTPSGAPAIQMLSYTSSGKDDESLPLSLMTKPGTVQPFTLSYDGSQVSVTLGNDVKILPLKVADPVVRIVCSTGEFLFTNLSITPR
ncbi:MAG: hypothetical protein QOG84_2532 [Sphingomonadales bacterium]|jgi:hypothetical protein|nr:hypothetical protein [Sphingomonadales bacterium]